MSFIQKLDSFGHKMFTIGKYRVDNYAILANFSTLSNLFLGIYASVAILFPGYVFTGHYIVARCIVLGASFDAIDGKLARRSNTQPKMGAQFDTAADLFTFGLAPGSMVLVIFYPVLPIIGYLLGGIYLFSASFRLSRFMIDPTTKSTGYFRGIPSPPAAVFIAGWYVLAKPDLVIAAFLITLIAGMMISSFPFTAMKQIKTVFQKINFVFTISIMLLFTYAPDSWMEILGILWIIQVAYFALLGPYHASKTLEIID